MKRGNRPEIKRPIPVILLARLGVDVEFQSRRFGNLLLNDVEFRISQMIEMLSVRSLVLDARDEELAKWYAKRGFFRFESSMRMFKSIADIVKLVEY